MGFALSDRIVDVFYTKEDWTAAQDLDLKSARKVGLLVVFLSFTIIITMYSLAEWILTGKQSLSTLFQPNKFIGFLMLILLLWTVAFFISKIFRNKLRHRGFKQYSELSVSATLSWDSDGFHFRNAYFISNHPWSHFKRWRENEKIALLYIADRQFYLFPKRLFGPEKLAGLRAYAIAAGIRGANI